MSLSGVFLGVIVVRGGSKKAHDVIARNVGELHLSGGAVEHYRGLAIALDHGDNGATPQGDVAAGGGQVHPEMPFASCGPDPADVGASKPIGRLALSPAVPDLGLALTAPRAGLGAAIGDSRGTGIGAAAGARGSAGLAAVNSSNANEAIQAEYNSAFASCMYSLGNSALLGPDKDSRLPRAQGQPAARHAKSTFP